MRFHIIRNARIENVGKSQSCMVSKVRIIWKQTVSTMGYLLDNQLNIPLCEATVSNLLVPLGRA